MIAGIGIDIIELARMQANITNDRFINRVLSEKEKAFYNTLRAEGRRVEFLAGRFAAKEAFAKAAGTGIGQLGFGDMEVLPNEKGAPEMKVAGFEGYRIFVSLSHSEAYAVAQVVLEKD